MLWMPGKSAEEPLSEPTSEERELSARLEADVRCLSGDIGPRNFTAPGSLQRAARWMERRFGDMGIRAERQVYNLRGDGFAGREAQNLVAEVRGTRAPDEIVVVGAHYDSVEGSPGANDNATGVAALLALAEWLGECPQPKTLRIAAFVNEEPPYFQTPDQGSFAYAARCRERGENVTAMMAFDGLGYYNNEPGSQQFPLPGAGLVYPDRGNFIGFVTRPSDAGLLRQAIGAFREHGSIPSEGIALPAAVPGIAWSDHWSFWEHGYPGFFLTDTLPFRYPHYHLPSDTPDKLDFERLARVVAGLKGVIEALGGSR